MACIHIKISTDLGLMDIIRGRCVPVDARTHVSRMNRETPTLHRRARGTMQHPHQRVHGRSCAAVPSPHGRRPRPLARRDPAGGSQGGARHCCGTRGGRTLTLLLLLLVLYAVLSARLAGRLPVTLSSPPAREPDARSGPRAAAPSALRRESVTALARACIGGRPGAGMRAAICQINIVRSEPPRPP